MKENKQKLIVISVIILVILIVLALLIYNNKKETGTISSVSDIKSMIKTIYKGVDLPNLETNVIDVKNEDEVKAYTGLQSTKDVDFLVISAPLMTSQAYLLSVVKAKDGANIEEMKKEMLDNINMNMWICVSADKLYITNSGNIIFLVMSSEDWAKPVYDNFKKYVNKVGKELTKEQNFDSGILPGEIIVD